MAQLHLPYGDGVLPVRFPDALPMEVISPSTVAVQAEPSVAIESALNAPIGTPPLEEMVMPGKSIAVIVDDSSRPTPVHLMLDPVVARLRRAGIPMQAIQVVIALGTHRPMTESEVRSKLGGGLAGSLRVFQAPGSGESRMVDLGRSPDGIPAWVDRVVVEADFRVGLGSITPHTDAGYSGGGKIILPGVCGRRTVEAFHLRAVGFAENPLGMVEAPLRMDLERFVGERVGLDFILNAVLDPAGRIYRCVAGHYRKAHRRGVEYARAVYGAAFERRHPVVVSNAFPLEQDLWQSSKALWSGEMVTEDGGVLILAARCPEGVGAHPLFAPYIGSDPDALCRELEEGRVEDPVAGALGAILGRIRRRIRLALVSPGLEACVAEAMGCVSYPTVDAALQEVLKAVPKGPSLGILTHGGVTLPVLNKDPTSRTRGPGKFMPAAGTDIHGQKRVT